YLVRLLHGDLGFSIVKQGKAVSELIVDSSGVTFKLALGAMLFASVLGVIAGILAAWRPFSILDFAASAAAALGISFPAFFLGMLLMLAFSKGLGWFPIGGYEEGEIKFLVLPCLSLGLISTASVARLTRNCMLETLSQDYIRTGRAKG